MPRKECSVMDERLQFLGRRLGEPMAELCREFGISPKTGYKIFERYRECGSLSVARSCFRLAISLDIEHAIQI
jgi:hypothetical protein